MCIVWIQGAPEHLLLELVEMYLVRSWEQRAGDVGGDNGGGISGGAIAGKLLSLRIHTRFPPLLSRRFLSLSRPSSIRRLSWLHIGIIIAVILVLLLALFAIYRLRRPTSPASTFKGAPQPYTQESYLPRYNGPIYPAAVHPATGGVVPPAVYARPDTGFYAPRHESKGVRFGGVGVRRF